MTQVDPSIPLSVKQFQAPDPVAAANNAMTLQSNSLKLQTQQAAFNQQQADAADSAKMSQVLSGIDPNDPTYDDKAVKAMHDAGVSPTKILTFKSTLLDQQKKQADVDLQKANAKEKAQDVINKADEHSLKNIESTSKLITDTTGDVVRTYDSIMAKGGPSAQSSANAAAKILYDNHLKSMLADPTLPDNIKKMVQQQTQQPFDINKVKGLYSSSNEHLAMVADKKADLANQKVLADIQRGKEQISIERARLGEEIREHKAEDLERGKQVVTSMGPDGKPVFTIIDKGTGTAKETTEVAVPKGSAGTGGREATMLGRQLNALAEGTKSLENLSEAPVGSSRGFFSGYEPGHGIAGTTSKNLTDALTSDEAKSYQVMTAGLSRAASTMETSGLAPSGTLTKQLHDAIEINPTDSKFVAMRKLAEARQILQEPIKNLKANPSLNAEQKAEIDKFDKRLNDAVPYTQHDLTEFSQKGKRNETFGDYAAKSGLGKKSTDTSSSNDDFSQYERK